MTGAGGKIVGVLIACAVWCGAAHAADAAPKEAAKNDIAMYLADTGGGAVSASHLVGVDGSAITEVQSSQDLIVAFKPFASSKSSKNGFGFAISPFRTTLFPMRASDYRENNLYRFLGGTTLSYAENPVSIDSIGYRKSGFSIDSSYYWNRDQDPVVLAKDAFDRCDITEALQKYLMAKTDAAAKVAANEATTLAIKCIDDDIAAKALWNASRFSISLGSGWIRADADHGAKENLGKFFTLNGIVKTGAQSALYAMARRSSDELDQTTLKTGVLATSNSTLVAARFTYGSQDDQGSWKVLAEISNAKSAGLTENNKVYKHAIGIDKRIMKGTWLEFRVGKSRTFDGTTTETSSLLNLKISPSELSKLFDKKT